MTSRTGSPMQTSLQRRGSTVSHQQPTQTTAEKLGDMLGDPVKRDLNRNYVQHKDQEMNPKKSKQRKKPLRENKEKAKMKIIKREWLYEQQALAVQHRELYSISWVGVGREETEWRQQQPQQWFEHYHRNCKTENTAEWSS